MTFHMHLLYAHCKYIMPPSAEVLVCVVFFSLIVCAFPIFLVIFQLLLLRNAFNETTEEVTAIENIPNRRHREGKKYEAQQILVFSNGMPFGPN